MKLYELTFADPEQGFIRQWRRNLKQVKSLVRKWSDEYPLRELISQRYVEVPADKPAFIEWLNKNASRGTA